MTREEFNKLASANWIFNLPGAAEEFHAAVDALVATERQEAGALLAIMEEWASVPCSDPTGGHEADPICGKCRSCVSGHMRIRLQWEQQRRAKGEKTT